MRAETGRIFRIDGKALEPSSPGDLEGRRRTEFRCYDGDRFGKILVLLRADH